MKHSIGLAFGLMSLFAVTSYWQVKEIVIQPSKRAVPTRNTTPIAWTKATYWQERNAPHFTSFSHTFEIANLGGGALTLTPLTPSMNIGSIVLDPPHGILQPNQTATYTIHIRTNERVGLTYYCAPLETNDPTCPRIHFRMLVKTVPNVIASQSPVCFFHDRKVSPAQVTFQLYSTHFEKLTVGVTSCTSRDFSFNIRLLDKQQCKQLGAKSGSEITCRYDGNLPFNGFLETVTFSTGLSNPREYTLALIANDN